MSEDHGSPWSRFEDPRTAGLAGSLLFGIAVVALVLVDRPLSLLYPAALVGAALLLARRARDPPVALAGFLVDLVGR